MEKQQPSKAALLSIIPGLGQIYNKQKAKGFIFLGVTHRICPLLPSTCNP
ncbi:sugar ABC transporter permease [Streptococcus pneumoniae]|nr:sugar ABC transporter permease [Streptococcus pneumoniae]